MRARFAAVGMALALLAAVPAPALSPLAQLGKDIFFDPSLSASGQLACASCHSPAFAYAAPSGGFAPHGGARLDRPPLRTVPSLRYLDDTPRFTRHYYLEHGEDTEDEGPAGGFMLDGRADTLHAQALLPWLDASEMGNADLAAVGRHLAHARYAGELRRLFGAGVFQQPSRAAQGAALALERFELEDPSFHPYSSRYDRFLAGEAALSEQELRGLKLFVDPVKGNCAECHPNSLGPGGRAPDFTDHAYRALGVPRNPEIAANADPGFHDLGLCGPKRADLRTETQYCGYFKTPTLRNSARRQRYFHNGRFRTLEQVLEFYAERDTEPQRWYPRSGSRIRKFDDLPRGLIDRVDTSDAPFNRERGDAPALSAAEIADLIALLRTLDDAEK